MLADYLNQGDAVEISPKSTLRQQEHEQEASRENRSHKEEAYNYTDTLTIDVFSNSRNDIKSFVRELHELSMDKSNTHKIGKEADQHIIANLSRAMVRSTYLKPYKNINICNVKLRYFIASDLNG